MIEFKSGDILSEPAEALVNTVNCVGVMGRGVALQFKNMYPNNFKAYVAACKKNDVQPGKMFIVQISQLTSPKYIINFPTKRHWKGKSRIEDIESGLTALVEELNRRDIKSIALPPLGCGLGGLNWSEVKPLIRRYLGNLENVNVIVFEPSGAPDAADIRRSSSVPNMTSGRAALIGLVDQYLRGLMDPTVSLLEIHKLMYFMQESGEPLKLQYSKALYGPYAENLGHVLNHVEGYYLSGYADGGDAPNKELKLIPGAVDDAQKFLENQTDTLTRFKRVAMLVDGFETPFGLELLATVHWVVAHEGAPSLDQALSRVYCWNQRKKQFSERQITLTYNTLSSKGWFDSRTD